jgi:hypothetical protein
MNKMMRDIFPDEKSPEYRQSRLARCGVMLSALTLMLSGCAEPSSAQNPAGQQEQNPVPEAMEMFDSPTSGCGSEYSEPPDKLAYEAARDCLAVYSDADIALVNFTLSERDANGLADMVEEQINHATRGIITADVTAVPANEEAIELFKKQNPTDCVGINDLFTYGSYAAAATMPDLAEFDKVVGVTDMPACMADEIGGVANPNYNRYAEIFHAGKNAQAVKDNGGEYEQDSPDGLGTIGLPNNSLIIAHEVLHLFNLGHSGTLYSGGEEDVILSELGRYARARSRAGVPSSLDIFVSKGFYLEYGRDNVMGNPSVLEGQTLDVPQIYTLEEPQRTLGLSTQLEVHEIDKSPIVFSRESMDTQGIALLELDEPLPMPRSDEDLSPLSTYEKFSTLMFVPKYLSIPERGLNGVQSLQCFIQGEEGSSVLLGTLYESDTPYQLLVQDKTITIKFVNETVTIS